MKYTTIIFDLDGTLLNSLEDLADSTNYALKQCGYPTHSIDEVRTFIGNGVEKLIERAVPAGTLGADTLNCLSLFKSHYQENKTNKTKPYDGIIDLLNKLNSLGIKTAIVTNKFQEAAQILRDIYFPGLIQVVVGASDTLKKKPDPGMVEKALSALDSSPKECLYVGDSSVDMQTAKNADLISVGVSWGFRSVDSLLEHGACHIINTPAELLSLL